MGQRQVWRTAQPLLLGAIIAIASTLFTVLVPATGTPVVEASVAQGKDDDKKPQKDEDEDQDRDEDHTLNGQVLDIDASKDPPEMIVGTVDGDALVRVLKTDEITRNGVKIGDYVELTGEKLHELLFEATEISVDHTAN